MSSVFWKYNRKTPHSISSMLNKQSKCHYALPVSHILAAYFKGKTIAVEGEKMTKHMIQGAQALKENQYRFSIRDLFSKTTLGISFLGAYIWYEYREQKNEKKAHAIQVEKINKISEEQAQLETYLQEIKESLDEIKNRQISSTKSANSNSNSTRISKQSIT